MLDRSEGVRRLSLFTGALGAAGWLIFVTEETKWFSNSLAADWHIIVPGFAAAFAVPFILVRAVAWVVRGFTSESR